MLCPDKICQTDRCQLLTDAVNVDAQCVIIHINLIVPQIFYDVGAGADPPGVFEKIAQNFQLILCQINLSARIFQFAAVQMKNRPLTGEVGLGCRRISPL